MKAPQLKTSQSDIQLVEPDIERDAPLSLKWVDGEIGKNTLSLMGVTTDNIQQNTLEQERDRIKDFIQKNGQLNWMIQLDKDIVGTIWVDLEPKEEVPSPAIHIMIGDPRARGKGVGSVSTSAVINYLMERGEEAIYSRYLTRNLAAAKLLQEQGFQTIGAPYIDVDGLEWQNTKLEAHN